MEISKENAIHGFKVFNPDWKCRGFQFEVGKTYHHVGDVVACATGFHACKKVADCFSYYDFNPNNKIAAVLQWGKIDESENDKVASEYIEVVKEISWAQMLEMANTGIGCSGKKNSGDWNSGDRNSGDRNSGSRNSGDRNSGDWNSGSRNSGDWNSGRWNSGDRNSGDRNSGSRNSGGWNSGSGNSGDWNSGDWNSGFFNSTKPTTIRIFNKECDINTWDNAKKPSFIYFDLTKWIDFDKMDSVEKKNNPKAEACGGYLKTLSYKEAWAEAYTKTTPEDIKLLKKLPNFDADVFFEISGIRL
jgi:hypothetical protein